MPSGFQQDSNQLSPSFYRVILTLGAHSGGSGATYPTANGTNNGAVNPYNWDTFITPPTTDASAAQLARGNLRWQAIVDEVSEYSDCQLIDLEVTGSDVTSGDTQLSELSFTVRYDRDSFVLGAYQKRLLSENSANTAFVGYGGGANYVVTTAEAVREMVTRGMIRGSTTGYAKSWRVFYPETSEGTQVAVTIAQPDTAVKIWYDVAVLLIDGTELITI